MDQNPPSFYAYTMESSGGTEFWQLLSRLMAAAGRPLVTLHDAPASPAGDPDGVARIASGGQSAHCGHGLLFDAEPELIERTAGATRLLFLRDPRLMTPNYYRQRVRPIEGDAKRDYPAHRAEVRPATFAAFLASPRFERVVECYRRFANLRRHGQNVVFLRYEHAKAGWHAIAADIVTALKLPIDPALAASIAADTPPVRDHFAFGGKLTAAAKTTLEKQFAAELATMEVAFADVLAALGYAPHAFTVDSTPRTADDVGNGAPRANRAVPSAGIFDADPVLHVRLRPNSTTEKWVLGRRIIMDVDATGCRPVIGQPATGEKTVAVYGCSFTYGVTVNAEETFCSLLQGMYPKWRFQNHGVSGYGTTESLLQLERDLRWNQPEIVTFCWIAHHLTRNVAGIAWVQMRSEGMATLLGNVPQRPMPRAALDHSGALKMQSVALPRYDLVGLNFDDYRPDPYYMDLVCFRLFERAHRIVTESEGYFFITTLHGAMSAGLAARLRESGIPLVDASLSGPKYNCLPDDGHPNALANRIYAERIRDHLEHLSVSLA